MDVTSDGHGLTNVKTESIVDCQPDARFLLTITVTRTVPLQADLSFSYTYSNSALQGSIITGQFDTAGNVTGTLEVHATITYNGTQYTCSAAAFPYHAKLGA
jgi:hypothetical protein